MKKIKTIKKPVRFCAEHLRAHRADERDGGGWTDMKPLCPDCDWDAGYAEGLADGRMFERQQSLILARESAIRKQ